MTARIAWTLSIKSEEGYLNLHTPHSVGSEHLLACGPLKNNGRWAGVVIKIKKTDGTVLRRTNFSLPIVDCCELKDEIYIALFGIGKVIKMRGHEITEYKTDFLPGHITTDGEYLYITSPKPGKSQLGSAIIKTTKELGIVNIYIHEDVKWFYQIAVNPATRQIWAKGLAKDSHVLYIQDHGKELTHTIRVRFRTYGRFAFDIEGNGYIYDGDVLLKLDKHGRAISRKKSHNLYAGVAYYKDLLYIVEEIGKCNYQLRILNKELQDLADPAQFKLDGDSCSLLQLMADDNLYMVVAREVLGSYELSIVAVQIVGSERLRKTAVTTQPVDDVKWYVIVKEIIERPAATGEPFELSDTYNFAFLKRCLSDCRDCPPASTRCAEIGCGGWGCVYKCGELSVKIPAYVKQGHSTRPEDLEHASVEAERVKSLRHPNILRLYHFCAHPPALIYEYADSNLARAKEKDILITLIQILEGVRFIHAAGLVHRDLKPTNILLKNGIVKIGDFSSLTSALSQTQRKQTACTFPFCPPEFYDRSLWLEAKSRGQGQKWDVYQVGNIALWLFGVEPLDGDMWTEQEVERRVREVDVSLRGVVKEMLQYNPWSRPTAEEVLRKLVRYVTNR